MRSNLTLKQRVAREFIVFLARRVGTYGELLVKEGPLSYRIGPPGSPGQGPAAEMRIVRPDVWTRMLTRRGCVESYIDGAWDTPNLVDLFTLGGRSVPRFDRARQRVSALRLPWLRLRNGLRSNSRLQSRRDIFAHYDRGNDLFASMLGPTMMYSSPIFPTATSSLDEAANHKLEVVCEKLQLGPDDHVVEIGGGWGGFAIYAAATRGCRVTTTTISEQQHRLATERVRAEGLEGQVEVRLDDYRDLRGTYDKLVSIEMIEAVGHRHFGTFFRCCSDLLKPNGRMLLQAITIDDRLYETNKLTRSFMRTLIFPNGCLPSKEVIARSVSRHTDMGTIDIEDLTDHYVRTLGIWRQNVAVNASELDQAGYDQRFRRLWNLYLSYAEAGFVLRRTAVSQFVMVKPRHLSRQVQCRSSLDRAGAP